MQFSLGLIELTVQSFSPSMRHLPEISWPIALAAAGAQAHKPSDSYLVVSIDGDTVRGQWDIALRDLDFAIGLDADGDGNITWGEVRARHADIAALGDDGVLPGFREQNFGLLVKAAAPFIVLMIGCLAVVIWQPWIAMYLVDGKF